MEDRELSERIAHIQDRLESIARNMGPDRPDGHYAYELLSHVADLRERVTTLEREKARFRGLIHAEILADMHYCETHEMGFQSATDAPVVCPRCQLASEQVRMESDLDAKHAQLVSVADKLANEQASLFRAQSAMHEYMVALGPHLSDSWREFLAKECGLEIDESSPYRHPKRPKRPL